MFEGRDISKLAPHHIARPGHRADLPDRAAICRNDGPGERHGRRAVLAPACRQHKTADEKAHDYIEFTGLGGHAAYLASELSLANRKRLELAKSLAMEPRLLFLDEVNAGLNTSELGNALDLIRRIAARGVTIIIIEHLLKVIMSVVDRIVVLHHGAMLSDGTPRDVINDPEVIKAYIGSKFAQRYRNEFGGAVAAAPDATRIAAANKGEAMARADKLLIKGGQVYDHDGDIHRPAIADILIEGGDIVAVGSDIADVDASTTEVLDASGRLVIPGLINAHYHSHDTLCRGLFEELPLEIWLLYTLPIGANRSKEEVRARTLVGALESLRAGITTVQDMLGLVPFREDYVDVVLAAYRDIGIRVVFAPMVADIPAGRHDAPQGRSAGGRAGDARHPGVAGRRTALVPRRAIRAQSCREAPLHWAVAPFAPQRCTPALLQGCAELADKHDLGVYTHVYETRGQALIARDQFAHYGGSLINYLDSAGLLGPRLNIVHSVWISRPEMERMAAADAGIVLNHLSNMKLKSGIAPVVDLREAGVRLGLGCDNCSGSDVQSMFQSMKMFCLLSAVSDSEPGPGLAHHALRHATEGNARSAGLAGKLGALKPGYKADMVLIDLNDVSYLPYNSAARQLVYTEAGRGVETVIVDGRPVIRDRRVTTIDEDGLRREVADLMRHFVADYDKDRGIAKARVALHARRAP